MSKAKQIFNNKGQIVEERTYGLFGLILENSTKYAYDNKGRVLTKEYFSKDSGTTITNYYYDPSGYIRADSVDKDGKKGVLFKLFDSSNQEQLVVGQLSNGHTYYNQWLIDSQGNRKKLHATLSSDIDIFKKFEELKNNLSK